MKFFKSLSESDYNHLRSGQKNFIRYCHININDMAINSTTCIPDYDDTVEITRQNNRIIKNLLQSTLTPVLLCVDASVSCSQNIYKYVKLLKKYIDVTYNIESYIVLINTRITETENRYKLQNSELYDYVDVDCINRYLSFLNSYKYTLVTPITVLNTLMEKVEDLVYSKYCSDKELFTKHKFIFSPGMKNRINDKSQIAITKYFTKIFAKNRISAIPVIFTDDRDLQSLTKVNNINMISTSLLDDFSSE